MITTGLDREQTILLHMPQVELLARRVQQRCPALELDDLISAGVIGLIHAVDRFDQARGLKLKTFAEHRIRGALLDYLRQLDPVPRRIRRFQKQRDQLIAALAQQGQSTDTGALARALGLSPKRYAEYSAALTASQTVSLQSLDMM